MASQFNLRGLTERQQRALPIIAAAYGLSSNTALILASIQAMIDEICARDPAVREAIEMSCARAGLPRRVKVAA